MKNYDKLKKIIQEANPEIMELKFGCEIEYIKYAKPKYVVIENLSNLYLKNVKRIKILVDKKTGLIGVIDFSDNCYKILGRPIRLADCTKAIIDSKRWKAQGVKDQAKDFFNLSMYWICDGDRDNLETKSERTKQFLIDLLC